MHVKNNEYRVFLIASLVVAFALTALRMVIILNNIEMESLNSAEGVYYLEGTPWTTVFAVMCVIVCAAYLIGAMVFTRGIASRLRTDSASVTFSSALACFVLASGAAYSIFDMLIISPGSYKPSYWAGIILSVIAAAYFLVTSKGAKSVSPNVYVILSIAPVVYVAVRMLYDFVEQSLTVTASSGSYHLAGLAVLMLFLSSEGRFTVGYKRKRLYVALGLIAAMLLLVYSLPALYLAAFWPISFNHTAVYCIVDIVGAIYIYCRLFSMRAAVPKAA